MIISLLRQAFIVPATLSRAFAMQSYASSLRFRFSLTLHCTVFIVLYQIFIAGFIDTLLILMHIGWFQPPFISKEPFHFLSLADIFALRYAYAFTFSSASFFHAAAIADARRFGCFFRYAIRFHYAAITPLLLRHTPLMPARRRRFRWEPPLSLATEATGHCFLLIRNRDTPPPDIVLRAAISHFGFHMPASQVAARGLAGCATD